MEQQEHTADSIKDLVKQLPIVKRVRLQTMLRELIWEDEGFEKYLTVQRFSGGRICPFAAAHMFRETGNANMARRNTFAGTAGRRFP